MNTNQPVPRKIPMSQIRLDPTRVRSYDDPEKLLELAKSLEVRKP
jgi:hypothetical protein